MHTAVFRLPGDEATIGAHVLPLVDHVLPLVDHVLPLVDHVLLLVDHVFLFRIYQTFRVTNPAILT